MNGKSVETGCALSHEPSSFGSISAIGSVFRKALRQKQRRILLGATGIRQSVLTNFHLPRVLVAAASRIAPYVNDDPQPSKRHSMPGHSIWRRYGYAWVTAGFFLISLAGHWLFAWYAFVDEQQEHHQPVRTSEYVVQVTRDTLENWQSEFLQLLWQVGGLALLLYVGSPQSKEGDDRMEAKLDEILRRIDPQGGEQAIRRIDDDYAGRHTDSQYQSRAS
jgi:hypothetical protein